MSDPAAWDLSKTALLTIDLQNDFIHPDGAYGRAGQGAAAIAALVSSVNQPARVGSLPSATARRIRSMTSPRICRLIAA